jgi:PKD repeat protein
LTDRFQNFRIYRNGVQVATTANLTYIDQLPQYGTYNYTVTAFYTAGESTPAGPATVTWESSGGETATLTGQVSDAINGNPIAGAIVTIAGLSATTNASGNYTIENIPAAALTADFTANVTQGPAPLTVNFTDLSNASAHTVVCSKEGYATYTNSQVMYIPEGQTLTLNISLSPQLSGDEIRFVLNWGAEPRDLDSHLFTPEIEGQTWEVWYSFQGSATSAPYAALDNDVTTGYGPETMTIYQRFEGTYKFFVYNYSGSPDIITSNAVVQIYNQTGLIHTVQIPTSGTGRYWYVADVDGATGQITIKSIIQGGPPEGKTMEMPEKPAQVDGPAIRNIISWNWNFGDGTTSTQQNPVKTYNTAGTYTVSLTVSDGTNEHTTTKTNYITATGSSGTGSLTGLVTDAQNGEPLPNALVSVAGLSAYTDANGNYTINNIPAGVLTANFSASTTSGVSPLTVNFFDQSTENSHTVTCEKEGYLTYSNNQVIIPQGWLAHPEHFPFATTC